MRFLFAVSIPFPEGRANTRRIHTIARELVKQGHHVTLLIPFARQTVPVYQVDGISVKWCYVPITDSQFTTSRGRIRMAVQLISRLKTLWWILLLSLRNQYDWLYLYQPGLDGLLAAAIARMTGHRVCSEYVDKISPTDYQSWSLMPIYYGLLVGDLLVPRLSSQLLVISSTLKQQYIKRAPQVPILIVPTVVDVATFSQGDPRRYRCQLGIDDRPLIVFTGSFTRPQGVGNLIRAMARVRMAHPRAYCVIAGGSMAYDCDDVDALIAEHNLQGCVQNLKQLPLSDVLDLLAAADCFVVPKLDDPVNHAGFSTKLAEYLAAGKPVVASAVGEIVHYFRDGETAVLCRPGDAADLAEMIIKVLDQPEWARRIGQAGKRLAEDIFDITPIIRRMTLTLQLQLQEHASTARRE